MEKRKFKINILDVVIFVVILCSVAVLVFRDTVNEVFTKPEVTTLEAVIFVNDADGCAALQASLDQSVSFEPDVRNDLKIGARVIEFKAMSNLLAEARKGEVKVVLTGYKRFGRFYTEDGTRIYSDAECAITVGDKKIVGTLLAVEIFG